MENATFIVVIFIVGILAIASFTQGDLSRGPKTTPPNPNAEFGVVHEKRSFFFSSTPPTPSSKDSNKKPPPPAPTPTPAPELEDILHKYVKVSMRSARSNKPDKEYIDVSYSSGAPKEAPELLNVSQWTISNSRGESYALGTATNLPGVSRYQNQDQLLLKKGGTIHVITGQSPLGANFRLNKCEQYFNQYHTFVPSISTSCPAPSKEPGQELFTDRCYTFVRGLNSCKIPSSLPLNLDNACREYINSNISYSACVDHHKYDSDFYKNEWWVYLNRPLHIWSDVRDTIILRNERGTAIASQSYQ